MRDQMPKSKKDLNVKRFPKLADALAKDKEFCSIVGHSSLDRTEQLDAIIKNIAPTVEYVVSSSSQSISQNFAMHLARTPHDTLSTAAQRLQSMFLEYSRAKHQRRRSRKSVAKRIGFIGNEINPTNGLPADIRIIELDPLPIPYPPEGHIILERPYSTPPPPPKKRDRTCSYLYKYCQLDETMLQYTLDADKEAIFVDKTTQEPILVVLRDFCRSTSSTTLSIVAATMFSATTLVRWLALESVLDGAVGQYLVGYAISRRQRKRLLVWRITNTKSLLSLDSFMLLYVEGCRDSRTTLSMPWKTQTSLAMIQPIQNGFHCPSTTKTSLSNTNHSLPPRDIFLATFHVAFTVRRVGKGALGESIGT